MAEKIVSVSSGGFAFCRYSIAILIWAGFIFKIKELVLLSFFILLLSAVLTVKRAPMIVIYDFTLGRLFKSKSKQEVLNVKAMRFAHSLGTLLSLLCLIFLYYINERVGWIIVFIFAIIKTISAFGFCPASKLYNCMSSGTCCAFARAVHKKK